MNYRGFEIRAELRTLEQHRLSEDGEIEEAVKNTDECEVEGYYAWRESDDFATGNFNRVDDVKCAVDLLLDPPAKYFVVDITCYDGEHEHVYRAVTSATSKALALKSLEEHEYECGDDTPSAFTSFGDGVTAARVDLLREVSMAEFTTLSAYLSEV